MRKSLIGCLLFALIVLGLAPAREATAGQPFMLATAGTGGTFYVIGGAMSDVMRRFDNTKATPITTNGSIENLRLVAGKKVAIGFSAPDLAYYAYNGMLMFKEKKLENLRYISGGHLSPVQIVVSKNSPIKKIADLKGKRVAVGAQGSAALTISLDVLGIGGMNASDIIPAYLSMTEMTEALQDSTVDAAIYSAGIPTSSVMNIFATKEMRMVPFSHKEFYAYLAKSGTEKKALLVPFTIPANTYRGQTETVSTMAWRACLVAHKDVPDALVYSFLKTIENHTAEMAKIHPSGKEYTPQFLKEGAAIPLHPGAAKFYAEKGIKIVPVK